MASENTFPTRIAASQAQKEVVANENFEALTPAALFARKFSACAGLVWGYYGGYLIDSGGALTLVADDDITLADDDTNYVEADDDGVVSSNTTAFSSGAAPLYIVVTAGGVVTQYTDVRSFTLGRLP